MSAVSRNTIYTVRPGAQGLPRLELTAGDGSRAEIYLHGAHITSWIPAGGHEMLFLSRASQFQAGKPIRGGIPLIFPQFGSLGSLPPHGFARLLNWEFAEANNRENRALAVFRLRDTPESRALWPHAFLSELTVAIGGNRLEATLGVTNTGAEPFTFTAALHTYLRVFHLADTCVNGLSGLCYQDAADGGVKKIEECPQVHFTGEVNRIYFQAPEETELMEPGRRMLIRKAGFTDTVVWNPGEARCAAMPDLETDAYRRFVCVEAAAVGEPVHLLPNARWEGSQNLIV